MKSIIEYINDNEYPISIGNQTYDYIDKEIIEHVSIEYNFSNNFLNDLGKIFESESGFKNDYKIVQTIIDIISKSDESIITINKDAFNCDVFFDSIRIYKSDDATVQGEYVIDVESDDENYNDIRWDSENKRFRFIEIIVKNDNYDISSTLMHELTHAYHDYQYLKNEKSCLAKRYKNSYYNKITGEKPESIKEGVLKAILYIIDNEEQDAIISNIKSEFKDKKFINYSFAVDWLNDNSFLYNAVKNAKNNVDRIVSTKDKDYIDVYREIVGSNKSDDKLYVELRNRFYKFWKKFCNHIGNMISNRLESPIKTMPHVNEKRLLEVLSYEKV